MLVQQADTRVVRCQFWHARAREAWQRGRGRRLPLTLLAARARTLVAEGRRLDEVHQLELAQLVEGLLALVAAVGRGGRPHLPLVRQELVRLLLSTSRDIDFDVTPVFLNRVRVFMYEGLQL